MGKYAEARSACTQAGHMLILPLRLHGGILLYTVHKHEDGGFDFSKPPRGSMLFQLMGVTMGLPSLSTRTVIPVPDAWLAEQDEPYHSQYEYRSDKGVARHPSVQERDGAREGDDSIGGCQDFQ